MQHYICPPFRLHFSSPTAPILKFSCLSQKPWILNMGQLQTPFLFFLPLLLSSTSLVYAIRHQKQNSETSVLSLPLHSRGSIITPQNKNYTALTISQLEGDIARVKYINYRIRNSLVNSEPNFQSEDIQSLLIPVNSDYVVRVGVGQPVKEFYLIADTGSDVNWLRCSPCTRCYTQSHPIFDPSQSSTYQPLPCSSKQCNALREKKKCKGTGTCAYSSRYADESISTGEFATETLSFGSSGSVNNVAIGCGRDNEGKLSGFAGLLGLGLSEISLPSQIHATSFSYCLVGADSNSFSTLEFNSAPPADSIIVPLSTHPQISVYYYVELTGITVGEDQIPIPPSVYQIGSDGTGIIVDSGTTLTYLDSQVYNSVRDAFRKNTQNLVASQRSFQGFETCYDVPSGTSASSVNGPSMSFQFSGGQTTPPLGPENYLFRVNDSAFCLAFKPTDQIVSIIGNIQQTGMRITYDLDKMVIGFSPNKC